MTDSDVIAYRKAVTLFKEGRILESLALFREAATTGEDRPIEHFALATAYMKTGQVPEARAEYERFFEMGGGDDGHNAAARKALAKLGAAPATSTAPASAPPGREPANVPLEAIRKQFADGINYYRAGGYQGALDRLEPLLDSYGRTPELLNTIANCFIGLGDGPGARGLLEEAVVQPGCPSEVFVTPGASPLRRGLRGRPRGPGSRGGDRTGGPVGLVQHGRGPLRQRGVRRRQDRLGKGQDALSGGSTGEGEPGVPVPASKMTPPR